jgi:hypothetical protein
MLPFVLANDLSSQGNWCVHTSVLGLASSLEEADTGAGASLAPLAPHPARRGSVKRGSECDAVPTNKVFRCRLGVEEGPVLPVPSVLVACS